MPEKPLTVPVEGSFRIICVSSMSEWDVLIFLHRHGTSLLSAGHIATLLGYNRNTVGKALESLEAAGLVRRSRSSRGVRLYRFAHPEDPAIQESLDSLLKLSEKRSGRFVVANALRESARRTQSQAHSGLHLAEEVNG